MIDINFQNTLFEADFPASQVAALVAVHTSRKADRTPVLFQCGFCSVQPSHALLSTG